MTQQVTITYKDDKTLHLLIPEHQLAEVIEDIKEDHKYFYLFNDEQQVGVWSCRDEIRHIIVQPFVEVKDEPKAEDSPSVEAVSDGNQDSEGREGDDSPEGEASV